MKRSLLPIGVVFLLAGVACGTSDDPADPGSGGSAGSSGSSGSAGSAGSSGGSAGSAGSGGTSGSAGGGGSAGSAGTAGSSSDEVGPSAAECLAPAVPAATLCEATANGSCYYIDPASGDDANGDGTRAKPWRSLANVVSYYGTPGENGSTSKPGTAKALKAGDVVYLFSGTFSDVYNYQGHEQVARFRGVSGTAADPIRLKAYPGEAPLIDPGKQANGLVLSQLDHFEVEGIEVANSNGPGITVEEADSVRIHRVHIHDTDGSDNNNIAGLYVVGGTNLELSCSNLHDNYDHTAADTGGQGTENSSDVVLFGGGGARLHHNRFWQTPAPSAPKTGGCIKYKHAATVSTATFEVDHNELSNCKFFGVGTGTSHTHVHHNVIENGEGLVSRDFGGPTHQTDQLFEFNTIYLASPLSIDPTDSWSNSSFSDPSQIEFSNNIVVHQLAQSSQERASVVIGTYGSDALYDKTVPELSFATNCYFNIAGDVEFALFAASGSYGSKGGLYSFSEWQGLGFDTNSVVVDPELSDPSNGDFRPAPSSPCAGMGAFAR